MNKISLKIYSIILSFNRGAEMAYVYIRYSSAVQRSYVLGHNSLMSMEVRAPPNYYYYYYYYYY
jgi:hypothetical protein